MKFNISRLYHPHYDSDKSLIAVLKNGNEISLSKLKKGKKRISGIRAYGSSRIIVIPDLNHDLAYLTGFILGDGTVSSPVKRKEGGFYWQVKIAGEHKCIRMVSKIVSKLFDYDPIVTPELRRDSSSLLTINSLVVHRFFNRVIGIKSGYKDGKTTWLENFCRSKSIFKHFLAGFTDADGHVGKYYVCIVQRDKEFLEKMKKRSEELLNINFRGPTINRKIENKVVGWMITLRGKEMERFLQMIPLRYKNK